MTLVQLRHLIALADTGSFSKAAQSLFLTQPALAMLRDLMHQHRRDGIRKPPQDPRPPVKAGRGDNTP
jgi:hypothetical protein